MWYFGRHSKDCLWASSLEMCGCHRHIPAYPAYVWIPSGYKICPNINEGKYKGFLEAWSYVAFLIFWSGPFQEPFSLQGIWICPAKRSIQDESLGHQLQAIMEGCKCYLNYRDSWRLTEVKNTCRDGFQSKPFLNRGHTDFACSTAFGERSVHTECWCHWSTKLCLVGFFFAVSLQPLFSWGAMCEHCSRFPVWDLSSRIYRTNRARDRTQLCQEQ